MSQVQYVFSPSTCEFFAVEFQSDYVAAGTWPSDAVGVTPAEYATYCGAPPEGKVRGADSNKRPCWVDAPPSDPAVVLAGARRRIRDQLGLTVDRVNAVWWDAMTETERAECRAYRRALLDMDKQPGFPNVLVWPTEPRCFART